MDKNKDGGAMPMEKYLKNIKLPADKGSIVNQAKQNGADNDTIQMLQKMPNKEYTTMEEIMEAMNMDM